MSAGRAHTLALAFDVTFDSNIQSGVDPEPGPPSAEGLTLVPPDDYLPS